MEYLNQLYTELTENPGDYVIMGIVGIGVYKLFFGDWDQADGEEWETAEMLKTPMPKQDFTVEQLRGYDGRNPKKKRLLIAVLGKVFDVTKSRHLYGKDGSYGVFAGRDATRGLALFAINSDTVRDGHDDVSDLTEQQMQTVQEWQRQFEAKYSIVGRLLKPGEQPKDYSAENKQTTTSTTEEKTEQTTSTLESSSSSPSKA